MAIDNPGKAWLQKAHYNLSFKRYLVYINIWKNANRSKENHTKRKKKKSIYPTSAFHAAHLYGGLNRDASCHPLWQGEIAHQVH